MAPTSSEAALAGPWARLSRPLLAAGIVIGVSVVGIAIFFALDWLLPSQPRWIDWVFLVLSAGVWPFVFLVATRRFRVLNRVFFWLYVFGAAIRVVSAAYVSTGHWLDFSVGVFVRRGLPLAESGTAGHAAANLFEAALLSFALLAAGRVNSSRAENQDVEST
ncbi:MAG: hypothetical protein HY876_01430 [Coriobacteriales bacterium]|nr:hypothetical protein [Coriobacteriales bacterium]